MNSFLTKTVVAVPVLFIVALLSNNVVAQTVVRGPYLQQASDANMVVKWRTSSATNSVVRYGFSPSNLILSETISSTTTEHEVLLTGLSASTKYYYSIGNTSGTLAGDSSYFFRTSPIPGVSEFSRLWIVGDSGVAGSASNNVRDAYKTKYSGDDRANMMIMLGDNAYGDGTDSEYQSAMFNTYPEILRQTPVWSTIGNHDVDRTANPLHTDPYFSIFSLPTLGESGGVPSGSEAYYSYNYANIHFVVLDSYSSSKSTSGAMLSWLSNDLAANDKEWLIAYWHHPPYSKGSHDSDTEGDLIDMRTRAVPILESYGVDLVFSGHSHSYERSYLIDGHYGNSDSFSVGNLINGGDGRVDGDGAYTKPDSVAAENMGAVYVVAGSSSRVTGADFGHEAMFISLTEFGSVVIDVNDNQLYAEFLNDSGQVADSFSISKGEVIDNTPPILLGTNVVNAEMIQVEFSESIEQIGATDIDNFAINFGVDILSASLSNNQRVVTLLVETLEPELIYTLTVNDVQDLIGNSVAQDSETQFIFNLVETREYRTGEVPNSAYEGMVDSYLSSALATTNFGESRDLILDGNDSGSDLVSLLRWDISDIPAGSTVTSASISLGISDPSFDDYPVWQVLKEWEESLVTWNSTGFSDWNSGGAQGVGDSAFTQLGVVAPISTGEYVLNLNSSGIQLVQDWVDGVTPNYGFLISSVISSDGVDIFSSESSGVSNRPSFSVTFENDLTASNLAPIVTAGGDQIVEDTRTATLNGSVFDDGLPAPSSQLIVNWDKIFGPGNVSFSNNNSAVTTATFDEPGTYILKLTVSDGELTRSDNVVVVIQELAFELDPIPFDSWLPAIYLLLQE